MTGAGEAEQPQLIVTFAPAVTFAPFAEKVRLCGAAGVAEEKRGKTCAEWTLDVEGRVRRAHKRGIIWIMKMKVQRCGMKSTSTCTFCVLYYRLSCETRTMERHVRRRLPLKSEVIVAGRTVKTSTSRLWNFYEMSAMRLDQSDEFYFY